MNKKLIFLLFAIFIFAYAIRVLYVPRLAITFGYDQARDAFTAQEILSGDIKILGPPASTPGLFHGVFYYYFLAPAYLIGNGSPMVAVYWASFFNALGVFIIFALIYLLTKKKKSALLGALLFAVSFEAAQYAAWLSNPTLGVWTVPLVYLGLWLWISKPTFLAKRDWVGPFVCALGLGLSIQAEIFLIYHMVPVLLWLYLARKNISFSQITKFTLFLSILLSSMVLVEVKFGFKSLGGIVGLIKTQDATLNLKSFGDFVSLYLNQMGRVFSNTLFPFNVGYAGFAGFLMLYWGLRLWKDRGGKILSWEPFLASYILSHLSVVSVGGVSTPFLTVGIGSGIVAFCAIVVTKIWAKNRSLALFLLFLIIISNLFTHLQEAKKGQIIFAIQKDMLLAKELAAVDYTYSQAQGEEFSINTLTSPLWVNTTWSYLYNWYGKGKYGYIPQYHGRDQVGRLGNNLPETKDGTTLYFLILEPMPGIPGRYLPEAVGLEDTYSVLLEEKEFGEIRVQKRVRKDE